ncbi:MAG: adenylyl-sulfate kinase [Candidatus Lokiarchaeota archaeon]|nr:adenylyl-sulfate kinase [Candidatus Lokiarchaeota archaeon]
MKKNGFAVWLTGLPGAGKSVIAEALQHQLGQNGIETQILKTDELRSYITPEPKYTDKERQLVYNAFSYMAKLLVENGINVIMDATGNLRKYRALAKEIIPNYNEVYLKCPLEVAMKREMKRADTKGAPQNIYKKALEGKADNVPGIQAEYEEPSEPMLTIRTDKHSIEECAKKIYKLLTNGFQ